MRLNGAPLKIVGVAARGFQGVSGLAQAWIPSTIAPRVTYAGYLTTNQNYRYRTSATCRMLPALRSKRMSIAADLKTGAGYVAGGSTRPGAREVIVGAQLGLAFVLLVACGLLLNSYSHLRQAPLGIDAEARF